MKKLLLFLYIVTASHFTMASELQQSCSTCPREAFIHLASGFFSTFNQVQGDVEFFTKPHQLGDEMALKEELKLGVNQEKKKKFSLNLQTFSPENKVLSYSIGGEILVDGKLYANMAKHYYHHIGENEAFYVIEAIKEEKTIFILGDVFNPMAINPEFSGVMIEGQQIIGRLHLKGMTFDQADRMLQRMERHLYKK